MRRRPWSLRRQLVSGLVVIVTVVCLTVGAVSTIALRQSLLERLETQVSDLLLGPAVGRVPQVTTSPGTPPGENQDEGPRQRLGSLLVVVEGATVVKAVSTDGGGTETELTPDQVTALLDATGERTDHVTIDLDGVGEVMVQRKQVGSRVVIAGMSTREVSASTSALAGIFAAVGLGAVAVTTWVGSVLIGRALRPLDRVAATAREVTRRPLDEGEVRLPERVPADDTDTRTEVGQVGASLNHLLGHVEAALRARQRSESRLRRFVADASHELRTPLASIRGYTELARREPERLSQGQSHSLQRIDAESRRMGGLVEDLLLLARLDAGVGAPAGGPVDLVHLAVAALGDAAAAGRDHDWRLDVPEDADAGIMVEGHQHRLHQVVANLLANARLHTPPGTTVVVGVRQEEDQAVLWVADDGPGIAPELRESIFDRFVRGDDARSRQGGSTGLGLSIAQAIARSHHGDLTLHNEPGQTRFEVRLPLRPAADSRPEGVEPEG